MELMKLLATALGLAIIIAYLRHINSELTYLAVIGSSIIMLISMLNCISETVAAVSGFVTAIKVNGVVFKTLVKAVGVGYLTEFTADIIEDMGVKSLSDKVILCGKFAIVIISLPIITEVVNLLSSLIA